MPPVAIRHVVIIEDDKPLAIGMQKLLVRNGFVVHTANNGRMGLEILGREQADLVITDIFMEDMEGLETIVAIKDKYPQVLIMAMSGGSRFVGLDCLDAAQKLGATKVLQKPFSYDTLEKAIQELNSKTAPLQT